MFSKRTSHADEENRLTGAVRRARERHGTQFRDLTVSNPTAPAESIPYDADAILGALSDPRAMVYAPEPLGLPSAREAVAAELRARGLSIEAAHVVMTASTSEAYATLFKVLCDPGDEILVPAPSYPLLDFLAAFDGVTLRPYPLEYRSRWHVDLDAMRAAVTPRTKAIVVVSPNNPTGSYLGREELSAMLDTGLPVISDEVFATYPIAPAPPADRVTSVLEREHGRDAPRGLVFALSGLSKLAALPQLKAGWIGVGGAPDLVARAIARLELVLDVYLSVAAPVQHALPTLLATRHVAEDAIRTRVRKNLAALRSALAGEPAASVLDVEGGWYAIVRVPEIHSDEEWAEALAIEAGVAVQPGYYFEMSRGAHLVLSLLTAEPVFDEGARRLAAHVARSLR